MARSPFDYVKSISNKNYIEWAQDDEKDYVPFIVNRAFSYFPDTILYANEMNMAPDIPKRLQYEYLFQLIRERKRYAPWAKPTTDQNELLVSQIYKYSGRKARQALRVLTDDQIEKIKKYNDPGGVK